MLGIERIFLRTINDCAAVRYQYKIKFGNFFYLTVFDLMAWFDLNTSWKITLIWPLFLLKWQILWSRRRLQYSSAMLIYCYCCEVEVTRLWVFLPAALHNNSPSDCSIWNCSRSATHLFKNKERCAAATTFVSVRQAHAEPHSSRNPGLP